MNWEAVGAIAELLGAAGVVITLAYLATQIRRSNQLALAESARFAGTAATPQSLAIAQDEDLARIFRDGLRDRASLNDTEVIRFDLVFGSLVGSFATTIVDQISQGFRGQELLSDRLGSVTGFLSSPGGSAWWGICRERYPEPFRSFVEDNVTMPRPPPA